MYSKIMIRYFFLCLPLWSLGQSPLPNGAFEWLIPAEYDDIDDAVNRRIKIMEPYFIVEKAGKKGVTNPQGKLILPIEYDRVEYRDDGLFYLEKKEKYAIANAQGQIIIPFQSEYVRDVRDFEEGLATVKEGKRYGYINRKGKLVIPMNFSDAAPFKEGLALVRQNGRYGYIDATGKWVILNNFVEASSFDNGVAWAATEVDRNAPLTWDLIDKKGNPKTLLNLNEVSPFKNGVSFVRKNRTWGLIDRTGKMILPCEYYREYRSSTGENFTEGIETIGQRAENDQVYYGCVDTLGKIVVPFQYTNVLAFKDGFARALHHNTRNQTYYWGIIDKAGKIVVPTKYDELNDYLGNRFFGVKSNGEWNIMNRAGNIITLMGYESVRIAKEGLFIVQSNKKYGLLDSTGRTITPCIYTTLGWFEEGFAAVSAGTPSKCGFLDKTGKMMIPAIYDNCLSFSGGLAAVKKDGKWGFIDKNNQLIIPFQFDDLNWHYSGRAFATVKGKMGVIKLKENPPTVTWKTFANLHSETKATTQSLEACIQSNTKPNFKLRVEGKNVETRGLTVETEENLKPEPCKYPFQQSLKLLPREQPYKIELEVSNSAGTFISERYLRVLKDSVVSVREKRLALVIGNSQYQNLPSLGQTPLNDAQDMAISLRSVGFTVTVVENATKQTLETQIHQFSQSLKDYEVGLIFFAGHGIGLNSKNYLIPTDFPAKSSATDFAYHCITTEWLQNKCAEAGKLGRTNILMVDACRDVSLLRNLRGEGTQKETWVPPSKVPTGFITCYATSQDAQRSQTARRNSVYTELLLKHLLTPNLKIEDLFKRVRIELAQRGEQSPEEITKLTKDFYFNRQ